jgi:hypothetical protein
MKKPNDAAQALIDAMAHKAKPAELRAAPKECGFCGHLYLEPCDSPEKSQACLNTKL